MSKLTLAWVRPTTPMRRPASCAIFVIFGRGLLALDLGRRRHPQHRDVLAQRRHGLRILRHVEIAADDGEIGLAVGERLALAMRAIGLHRAQTDLAAVLVLKACVSVWTTLRSSLLAGPTAIRKVTGRIAK